MRGEGLPSATRFLALAMSALYLVAALGGPVLINFDSTRDVVFWLVLLVVACSIAVARRAAPA